MQATDLTNISFRLVEMSGLPNTSPALAGHSVTKSSSFLAGGLRAAGRAGLRAAGREGRGLLRSGLNRLATSRFSRLMDALSTRPSFRSTTPSTGVTSRTTTTTSTPSISGSIPGLPSRVSTPSTTPASRPGGLSSRTATSIDADRDAANSALRSGGVKGSGRVADVSFLTAKDPNQRGFVFQQLLEDLRRAGKEELNAGPIINGDIKYLLSKPRSLEKLHQAGIKRFTGWSFGDSVYRLTKGELRRSPGKGRRYGYEKGPRYKWDVDLTDASARARPLFRVVDNPSVFNRIE